jgi:hypothetical protein
MTYLVQGSRLVAKKSVCQHRVRFNEYEFLDIKLSNRIVSAELGIPEGQTLITI